MSRPSRMGRSLAFLHIFILLSSILHHLTGCNARVWRMTEEMEEVAEVVHSSTLSLLHRRQLQTASYCVAQSNADQTQLQIALDWACGPVGKVDCSAIQVGGSCYNPNTVADHATYAFNAYYYAQNAASGSCNFNGLATPTSTKPSTVASGCNFPAYTGSGSTSNGTSPGTTPGTSTPPPPSTTSSNVTFSPPSNSTFDNGPTSGTISFSTFLSVGPLWLHALCGGTILMVLLKL